MTGRPRPSLPLSDRERLAVQLYGVHAGGIDLRHHKHAKDAAEFRDYVRELRRVTGDGYRFLPYVDTSAVGWARARLEVRAGIKPDPGYWTAGEGLDGHTQDADLRFLLEWLEAIR
jgi:hypothetical protein